MKIYCDIPADDATLQLLKAGVGAHELLFPAVAPTSVLAQSGSDPALAEADIAFGQPDAAAVLASARLQWVHVSSAGYTRYDTPEFRGKAADRGLVLSNSSTVYAEPCAQHVLSFMLANARRLPGALGAGSRNGSAPWLRLRAECRLLRNQCVLLLGYGVIAAHLARLLRPFDVRIAGFRRRPTGQEEVPVISERDLDRWLAEADHVVNVLPANAGSERFMNRERFEKMKAGAVFYNVGRGTTVDQDALLSTLQSGRLSSAWLDVTEPEPSPTGHPLLRAPNCYITPQIAGGHGNESETLVRHFLRNFQRFLNGEPLIDRVTLPQ